MPHVKIDAHQLFYAHSHAVTPNAPTLVLIHGAGGSRLHWPSELRRLPNANVYTLDLPGHGRSAGSAYDRVFTYAKTLIDFLDVTNISKAILLGHSMGGAIAQTTALNHPERVSGLVLIGAGAKLRVAPALLENVQKDFQASLDLLTRWLWADHAPQELVQRGREALNQVSAQTLYNDFLACDNFDLMAQLAEIDTPTLVIVGSADRLTPPKYARYLVEQLSAARLVTIKDGGHMVALEQPTQVAQAVADFIQKI